MNPPANWYPDPTERHEQRYWDGEQWTEHVFTDGVQAVDPLDTAGARTDTERDSVGPGDTVDAGVAATAADAQDDTAAAEPATTVNHVDEATTIVPDSDPWVPGDEVAASEVTADEPATETEEPATDEAADDEPATDEPEPATDEAATDAPADADEDDEPEPGVAEAGPETTTTDSEEEARAVAPEVEPTDVVANVDDVATTPIEGDFSDAFLLSPETASRLVPRSPEPGEPDDDQDTSEVASEPDDTATSGGGAIDAPPPEMPTATPEPEDGAPTALGISGDLVGGAFAEREDTGAVGLQNSRLLRCSASGGVIARQGTMVAYQGDVEFERQGAGGVGRALKRAATGEGLAMMRVSGQGDVFLADAGQHVFLLHLSGGPGLSVNGRNVLGFSAALQWDIERVKGASLLAGGLFNTTLTGTGWVALVSDGEPVVLRTDEARTYVDVNALVAWSAGLSTEVVNTVTAKSLVGLGSGEAFQMAFDGPGVVVVQPSEGPMAGASG